MILFKLQRVITNKDESMTSSSHGPVAGGTHGIDTASQKTHPSKNCRQEQQEDFFHFIETIELHLLATARQRVATLNFTPEKLQRACGNDIRPYKLSYKVAPAVFRGLLSEAVLRNIDISIIDGVLSMSDKYNDSTLLSADDKNLMQAVLIAFNKVGKVCSELALAEAMQRTLTEQEAGANNQEQSLEAAEPSSLEASASIEAESSQRADTQLSPKTTATSISYQALTDRLTDVIERGTEMNRLAAEFLAEQESPLGQAIRTLRLS